MTEVPSRNVSLPGLLDRLLGWFVSSARGPEEQRTCRLIVGFTLTVLCWSPGYAAFYLVSLPPHEAQIALTSLVIGMSLVAAVPTMIRMGISVSPCVALLGVNLAALMLMICSMTGGFRSPLLAWVVLLPLLGLWFGGTRMAWLWNSLVFLQLGILAAAPWIGLPVYDVLAERAKALIWGATIVSITLTNFVLAWIYESMKHQTIRELERASQAKSDFLAHMSHEIRTPMTAILGYAEMLEEDKLEADQQESLRTIRRNGEHLIAVINDILDLSRVESGNVDLQIHPARPDLLLREVATLIQPRAAERGLEVRLDVAANAKVAIHTDATRLRQILINLAGNAVKFTESGHVRLGVSMDPERQIRFEIEDTGPGIPPEKLSEIWKPFTQVDASMARRYGGTGLGLAISCRLARALGGNIWVESEVGRGTLFRLRLPAGAITERADTAPLARAARVTERLHGHVLVAEDGADNRRLLVHLLERWGLRVETAENGSLAVEGVSGCAMAGDPVELVLMDMQMPGMDGYEAARKLRDGGYQGPIVALTAHAMDGSRERCLAAGCDDFLTKPVDRAQLRAVIASYLDRPATAT